MKYLILDYETASVCDLKKSGAWRYAEDPTTEIICLYYKIAGTPGMFRWSPVRLGYHLREFAEDPEVIFVAQNVQFEKAIWRKMMVPIYGFPNVPNSRWHDVMATAAMRVLPLDLDHRALVLRLLHQKDREGSKLTKGLSKPRKDGSYDRSATILARVGDYCEQDVLTEEADFLRLGPLPAAEHQVWLLDQRINERGIRLDLDFIHAAQKVVTDASVPLIKEFRQITGVNPTQVAKIGDWLRSREVFLPDMRKETLTAILGNTEGEDDEIEQIDIVLPPEVHRALSIRQLVGSASVKKLARMDACVSEDHRARGTVQYHGAGPGRWSGRLFQPHNFPRGTIKIGDLAPPPDVMVNAILTGDHEYVDMLLGPAVQVVVSALRHAIVPSKGRLLTVGDFAGIEARLVLALAGQHDKTALMASGADMYCDMASQIYKRPIDKKKDPEERQTGKNSVLGLGFQMGAPKFRLKYAQEHPLEFAQNVVRTYRKEWAPKVPPLWYAIEDAAVRAVWDRKPHEAYGIRYELEDQWLTARLPSGRKLWYFNPQKIRKPAPWDANEIKSAWSYNVMKTGQWKTVDAYGGLLTENVVQAMARDILVAAMFKAENNNLPIVLTVHDELVTEPETAYADPKALQQIMTDVPNWVREIQAPIAAETWTGDRYKK